MSYPRRSARALGPARARLESPALAGARHMTLRVTSEVGKLSSVLVHLPGPEIDRMIPAMMGSCSSTTSSTGPARARSTGGSSRCSASSPTRCSSADAARGVLRSRKPTARVLEDLGRKLGWGPDMDYRLRELPAAALASTLVAGIEKPEDQDAAAAPISIRFRPLPNWFFQRDPLVRGGRSRDPRLDGDLGAAERAPAVRIHLPVPSAFSGPEGGILVPGVLRRLRPPPRTRACGRPWRAATFWSSAKTSSRSVTRSGRRRRRSRG